MLALFSIILGIVLSTQIFLEWMQFLFGLLRNVDVGLIRDMNLALTLIQPWFNRQRNTPQIQVKDFMIGLGQALGRG